MTLRLWFPFAAVLALSLPAAAANQMTGTYVSSTPTQLVTLHVVELKDRHVQATLLSIGFDTSEHEISKYIALTGKASGNDLQLHGHSASFGIVNCSGQRRRNGDLSLSINKYMATMRPTTADSARSLRSDLHTMGRLYASIQAVEKVRERINRFRQWAHQRSLRTKNVRAFYRSREQWYGNCLDTLEKVHPKGARQPLPSCVYLADSDAPTLDRERQRLEDVQRQLASRTQAIDDQIDLVVGRVRDQTSKALPACEHLGGETRECLKFAGSDGVVAKNLITLETKGRRKFLEAIPVARAAVARDLRTSKDGKAQIAYLRLRIRGLAGKH